MGIVWGVLVSVLALVCWGGQVIAWLAPERAVALGLRDSVETTEPVFSADGDAEAKWDALSLWTLLVAGILLVFDASWWPYFGLVGGAMYVYFAGRGLLVRREMQRRGFRIGDAAAVKVALAALSIWGVAGVVTIVAAVRALSA